MEEQNQVNVSLLEEYKKLSDVESAIKERKDVIKKYFKEYLETNGLAETPEFRNLIGKLEERIYFNLDAELMEQELPPSVFNNIVKKEVNLIKAKEEFLNGRIPIELLRRAETQDIKNSFYVRKADVESKETKSIPFWRSER